MGCFVSCFRTKDQERARIQLSNSDSHSDQVGVKVKEEEECVVEKELLCASSTSCNGEKEKEVGDPCTLEEPLTQQVQKTKHLKPNSATHEDNLVENCQLNKTIPLQELNGSDQSSEPAHTLSNKKIQLVVQCEQENSPDQEKPSTPTLGNEISTSSQKTPSTGSCEEITECKLDLFRNYTRVLVSDPNSPCLTPIALNGEMQTPATVYPLYKGATIIDKQVYAALKPAHQVEISSGFKSDKLENENEVAQDCSTKKCSEDTPKLVVPELSQCLNGIPNTTTKYKEDQRVKWHATPFEERLERILSDEKTPPPRKFMSGRLIQLEE